MRKLRNYFLTVATLICSVAATWAQTTFENKARTLKFTVIDEENHYVSVKGRDYYLAGALEIPETVKYPNTDEGVSYTVTSIDEYAFNGYTRLTSVTIPKTVTNIGAYAFSDCIGLTSITIPESVTEIGQQAFYYYCNSCSFLSEIIFEGETPPTIGVIAFGGRDCLFFVPSSAAAETYSSVLSIETTEVVICSAVTEIGGIKYALNGTDKDATVLANNYSGNVVIPESIQYSDENYSVTAIGKKAFKDCLNLSSITIPESVTSIGYYAFENCTGLTAVTVPNSVTSIGQYAFYNCTNANEFVFGENVESIGGYALSNCTNAKEFVFENATAPTFGVQVFHNSTCPIYVPTAAAITDYKQANNMSSYADRIQVKPIVVDGVKYEMQEDGTCTVVANDYSGDVVIHGSIDYYGVDATVTTISGDAFKGCSHLTSVVISDGVTLISDYAFSGCTSLLSVSIPGSVTSIGYAAFQNCSSLPSVTIPGNVTSIGCYGFRNCSSLASITISEGVTTINSDAFSGCTSLTEITIPESVTTIKERVFKDCNSLETVYFNAKNCTKMGYDDYTFAFTGCTSVTTIIIGDNVETIPRTAFKGCSSLKTLTIPASVTTIGNYAFDGCNKIETLTFDSDAIGNNFNNNANLKTLNIGNSVTKISSLAFRNCTGLTSINIPEGVTSIGSNAFEGCTGLKSVTIPASVTTFGSNSSSSNPFAGCTGIETLTYNTDAVTWQFSDNPSLKTLNIGNAVTKIGGRAFENCTGLTSVVVPNSVTSIGGCAFYGCSGLTKITLPFVGGKPYTAEDTKQLPFGYIFGYTALNTNENSPYPGSTTIRSKYIGDEVNGYKLFIPSGLREVVITGSSYIQPYAFNNCSMLTSITIPASVTSVGKQAFRYTDSEVIFEGATPPSFGEYVFENSSSYSTYPIYVPTEEAVDAYKAAENMQSDYYDYRNRVMVNPYCKITVAANNSDYGTVSGGGTYNITTTPTVTITATAAEHYSFVCWAEDGATEASREVAVAPNATYTAIFKRTVTISNVVAENKEYNGNAEAAISYDVDGLLDGDDVTVITTAAFADANAGEGKVVDYSFELSGNDADNYVFAEGSQSGTVTAKITPILVSEPEIVLSATEFTYSGEAQTPTVTVKTGETVIAAAEYEVSFSDDVTNVGEKTVTVSNKAGNYTVNGSATYTINPAAEAPNKPEAAMETRCINTEFVELPENWQWTENKALALGDNTATAEYNGADAGNYVLESIDIAIIRIACEHTGGVDIINALEPTCTAEGYSGDQRCKICGEIIATGEAIPAAGHKADSVVLENIVRPTLEAAGSYDSVVYCSVCKVELSRKTIDVLASAVAVSKLPNKVEYKQGEALDVKGGKLTATYSDESTAEFEMLAGWVSGFDSEKVGKQTLTVKFETVSSTLTTTFDVTVNAKDDDNTAIDEDAVEISIYAYSNIIVVEAADAITGEIAVFDVNGRMVRKTLAAGTRTEIQMQKQGLYIVRYGTEAKRVVIK